MYQLILNSNYVRRISDGAQIPDDPANSDYAAYLAWVNEGGQVLPAEQPEPPSYVELRAAAYAAEADPLFFQEQRGEVPAGTWEAKIGEIKARYPKPSV